MSYKDSHLEKQNEFEAKQEVVVVFIVICLLIAILIEDKYGQIWAFLAGGVGYVLTFLWMAKKSTTPIPEGHMSL